MLSVLLNRSRHVLLQTLFVSFLMTHEGCKKFVDIQPPPTALTSDNVYESDATAIAVITSIYASMSASDPIRGQALFLATGLSSDELTLYGGSSNANVKLVQYYQNRLTAGSASGPDVGDIWAKLYSNLYILNGALEKLSKSDALTPSVKNRLIGEAKFMRAFSYYYLVNLYGDVPLTTTTDYRVNIILPRTARTKVYEQVIADLKDAKGVLSESYVGGDGNSISADKLRPNKWAATALLARGYLGVGDWSNSELESSNIIQSGMYSLDSLNEVFLKNKAEAIWQLQPVNIGWNTEDARLLILSPSGPTTGISYPVYLSNQLLGAFEPGDKRKTEWVNSVTVGSGASSATYYYPYKYKSATLNAPVTEYTTVLRLAEQYLIRAEARARQGNIQGAQADLNVIRKRAGLSNTTASDQASLLAAILHERQVELFTEWGHRWVDLKRTGMIDQVMSAYAPQKGTTWSPNWALYPIPLYDITQNPKLTQNPGY